MDDLALEDLGLAGTTNSFGTTGHDALVVLQQHLGDGGTDGHLVLIAGAVHDDGELVVSPVAIGIDDLGGEALDVRRRTEGLLARILEGREQRLRATAVDRGVRAGLFDQLGQREQTQLILRPRDDAIVGHLLDEGHRVEGATAVVEGPLGTVVAGTAQHGHKRGDANATGNE